ncbi:putative cell cycle checkpoint protein RAD17-like [Apostichopus japonicus]|uniref:Putative cell cycle checkpoint protein RAD17-like n=1 Tax=Stichopus japonicus TaxID=307972 RepID=A0A2G8JRN5_STIJA|nr:putative cell cycle checkpoint protein RAD17-like [Apostichopus japonicus]
MCYLKALFIGEAVHLFYRRRSPFLALANVPLHDPAQISFLQEVGYFALQHFNTGHLGRRLDEKDLEQDEYDEDSIPSSQTRRNLHKPEIVSEQVDALTGSREEDIIIEDFVD